MKVETIITLDHDEENDETVYAAQNLEAMLEAMSSFVAAMDTAIEDDNSKPSEIKSLKLALGMFKEAFEDACLDLVKLGLVDEDEDEDK